MRFAFAIPILIYGPVFAGTSENVLVDVWRMNPATLRSTPENPLTYEPIDNGWRIVSPYSAAIRVTLDGQARPDPAAPGRTVMYKRTDLRAYETVTSKDAGVISMTRVMVSPDGGSLTRTSVIPLVTGGSFTSVLGYRRATANRDAADPFAGTWQPDPARTSYSDPQVETITAAGQDLHFTISGFGGEPHQYTARPDGDYPVVGWPAYDAVSVRQTGPRSFERVFKKNGAKAASETLEVSAAGKSPTRTFETHPAGGRERKISIVYERQ